MVASNTRDSRADDVIRRHEQLVAERRPWETQWQEVAELVKPMRAEFLGPRTPGAPRTDRLFDATAAVAADNLAAGLWGMMTNAANDWFALRHPDEAVDGDPAVRRWMDDAGRRMRLAFAANGQRFYAKVHELYADLVCFGTAVFYADENPGAGLFFSCRHLAECAIAENAREEVDMLHRRFLYSARQAAQRWGEALSEPLRRAAETEPDRKFPFLHAVAPRAELGLAKGPQPVGSLYVDVEGRRVVGEGAYWEFPYQVPRWSQASRGLYGDSPALMALPDIKMLNAMGKTTIVAAQKAADPPILAPDEAAVRGIRTSPGQIIYGGIDAQGRRLYEPFVTGANVGLGLELEDQRRAAIREAFHFSLLMMVGAPNRTATEVLAQQEEKLRLMGPHLGRLQSEFLDPLIKRVFRMMLRAGSLPPPPRRLVRDPALRIEYVSPLARAQRASEGAAIVRTLEAIAPVLSLDPAVAEALDAEAVVRALADAYGAPARLLRDPKTLAKLRDSRQRSAAMQAMLGAAPALAGAAKDLAEANRDGAIDRTAAGLLGGGEEGALP